MAERKSYERVPMVIATNFERLCATVGNEQAGHLTGVGYSTVSRYRSTGKCPKAVEKAAEFEMLKRDKGKNLPAKIPDEIIILKVPTEKMEYLMIFLKGADIKHARFKDSS